MDNASEAILALKPVAFRYKDKIDPGRIPQFGLIAESERPGRPQQTCTTVSSQPLKLRRLASNLLRPFTSLARFGRKSAVVSALTALRESGVFARIAQNYTVFVSEFVRKLP